MQPEISPASIEPPQLSQPSASANQFARSANPFFASKHTSPNVRRGHLVVVVGLVVAADLLLYQGGGALAGWAIWCVVAAVMVAAGVMISMPVRHNAATIIAGLSLMLTAFRLLWQGSGGLAALSVLQLAIFAFVLHDVPLSVHGLAKFLLSWLPQGCRCLPPALLSSSGLGVGKWRWLEFGVPALITGLFATIFLMANPDAVSQFGVWLQELWSLASHWLIGLRIGQPLLWLLVIVLGLGAVVPPWKEWLKSDSFKLPNSLPLQNEPHDVDRAYLTSRNTFAGVIILFAGYLIVEFWTMWFREFPQGFHYSGYAHAGAAWLTAALALATVVVSAIVRPNIQQTSGYATLLKLARIWSVLNFILAICVFNRLFIYIDYNGMTRMRVVAILGVCCVIAGFVLVMTKAGRGLSFGWLVDRQLMTLAMFVYLLAADLQDAAISRFKDQVWKWY